MFAAALTCLVLVLCLPQLYAVPAALTRKQGPCHTSMHKRIAYLRGKKFEWSDDYVKDHNTIMQCLHTEFVKGNMDSFHGLDKGLHKAIIGAYVKYAADFSGKEAKIGALRAFLLANSGFAYVKKHSNVAPGTLLHPTLFGLFLFAPRPNKHFIPRAIGEESPKNEDPDWMPIWNNGGNFQKPIPDKFGGRVLQFAATRGHTRDMYSFPFNGDRAYSTKGIGVHCYESKLDYPKVFDEAAVHICKYSYKQVFGEPANSDFESIPGVCRLKLLRDYHNFEHLYQKALPSEPKSLLRKVMDATLARSHVLGFLVPTQMSGLTIGAYNLLFLQDEFKRGCDTSLACVNNNCCEPYVQITTVSHGETNLRFLGISLLCTKSNPLAKEDANRCSMPAVGTELYHLRQFSTQEPVMADPRFGDFSQKIEGGWAKSDMNAERLEWSRALTALDAVDSKLSLCARQLLSVMGSYVAFLRAGLTGRPGGESFDPRNFGAGIRDASSWIPMVRNDGGVVGTYLLADAFDVYYLLDAIPLQCAADKAGSKAVRAQIKKFQDMLRTVLFAPLLGEQLSDAEFRTAHSPVGLECRWFVPFFVAHDPSSQGPVDVEVFFEPLSTLNWISFYDTDPKFILPRLRPHFLEQARPTVFSMFCRMKTSTTGVAFKSPRPKGKHCPDKDNFPDLTEEDLGEMSAHLHQRVWQDMSAAALRELQPPYSDLWVDPLVFPQVP